MYNSAKDISEKFVPTIWFVEIFRIEWIWHCLYLFNLYFNQNFVLIKIVPKFTNFKLRTMVIKSYRHVDAWGHWNIFHVSGFNIFIIFHTIHTKRYFKNKSWRCWRVTSTHIFEVYANLLFESCTRSSDICTGPYKKIFQNNSGCWWHVTPAPHMPIRFGIYINLTYVIVTLLYKNPQNLKDISIIILCRWHMAPVPIYR